MIDGTNFTEILFDFERSAINTIKRSETAIDQMKTAIFKIHT